MIYGNEDSNSATFLSVPTFRTFCLANFFAEQEIKKYVIVAGSYYC